MAIEKTQTLDAVHTIRKDDFFISDEGVAYTDEDVIVYNDIREFTQLYKLEDPDTPFRTDLTIIFYCCKGRLQVEFNGEIRTISAGQIVVCVPQSIMRNYMLSPDFQCMIMCVTTHILQETLRSDINHWNDSLYVYHNDTFMLTDKDVALIDLYRQLFAYKRRQVKTLFYKRTMQSLVQAMLYEICERLCHPYMLQEQHLTPIVSQGRTLFYNFLELLKNATMKRQTVEYYAKELCVTPKYLSFVCKRETGRPALEWIQDYLLEEIRYHLNDPKITIKEVAARTGFTNLSFFGRYVKEHFGASPRAYRKQLLEKQRG